MYCDEVVRRVDRQRLRGYGGGAGGGGRRRDERCSELAGQQGEVGRVHDAVVVEIALPVGLAAAAEVAGEEVEIGRIHRTVVIRVGGQREEVEDVVGSERVVRQVF